jgi:hypothetical protein
MKRIWKGKPCDKCGKIFRERMRKNRTYKIQKFCSMKCYRESRIGVIVPNFKGGFKKGSIPWNKGKKDIFSKETKEKMKLAKLGKSSNAKGSLRSIESRKKMSILGSKRIGRLAGGYKDGRWSIQGYSSWKKNNRNRKKRSAIGSHTFKEWEKIKEICDFTCLMCGEKEPDIKLTEDHIIPLSKGGSDYINNIQPLCKACNCRKHAKIINLISQIYQSGTNKIVGGGGI